MINGLDLAGTYFAIKYQESQKQIVNVKKAKTLRAVIDILDPKFSEREYSANESGLGVLVRKQEGQRYNWKKTEDEKNRKICVILEKEVVNGLGMDDSYYFYIVYRNRLLSGWANALDLKKYYRKPGFYLPFSILKHIETNKVKYTSELILMLNLPDVNPRLFSIKSADLFHYFTSNKLPMLISAYGEWQTAVPLEIMEEMKE